MGHPKKQRKKYSTPQHPWQKARIEEEKVLLKEYGLKNKKEIWKMNSILKTFYLQAKRLASFSTKQSETEKARFLEKLRKYGFLEKDSKLEDVLTITLKDILARRLQTLVYNKKLARSIKQARQFITHRHIIIGDTKLTRPSYLIAKDEENEIRFAESSSLSKDTHPEREIKPKEEKKVKRKPRKNLKLRKNKNER